ncbi:MAG: restriction endonuclease subunit S [Planctomycetota bacterium]|nr:MAG: restriction endonuclease subunit S [Planctomycetota bacterium]
MASEWGETTIGDFAQRVTKGTTPTTLGGRFVEAGISYVKVESITNDGRFQPQKFAFIDEETNRLLERSVLQEDDVFFTIAGTIGRVSKVNASILPANTNQAVAIVRPNRAVIDPQFLYYALRDGQRVRHAQTRVVQSVQANFSLTELSAITIPLPDKEEQRAIAHILGTLDDKIELNRRMNETLEAMARALFKSWFVDFDPVRAKAEGRDPSLPQPLADIFPARLVNSELGEIPEGWEVKPLPEVVTVNPSRSLRKGDVAPYLDMANMPTRGHSPDVVINRTFGSGMRFVNGDTLVARITPCLENGKTAYVDFLGDGQVGWGSTEYIVLRPKPPLPTEFAYCLARNVEFRDFAIQSMTGSSGRQRVPAGSLSHFQVVVAPKPIAERFGKAITPLFARANKAAEEVRILASLRNTLLPKLISGELRVKDTEQFIERTTT